MEHILFLSLLADKKSTVNTVLFKRRRPDLNPYHAYFEEVRIYAISPVSPVFTAFLRVSII